MNGMRPATFAAVLLTWALTLSAGGALRAAARVSVEAGTGAVTIEARGEPLGQVLTELRRVAGVQFMLDADLEAAAVTLTGRFADGRAALRALAIAAKSTVEEAGGITLMRRARAAGAAPFGAAGAGASGGRAQPAAVTITVDAEGAYAAPGALDYPVIVLGDRPWHATITAAYAGFEDKAGIGLISAREVQERAVREYLESRPVYRRILERAGADISIRDDIEQRWARVYVEPDMDRMFVEVLYAQTSRDGKPEIVHLVYFLKAQVARCDLLAIFKRPA